MNSIKKHINLLGLKAKDKITGLTGIITCISFDLYGCIQVILNPGMKDDGTLGENVWFDISRMEILTKKPVIKVPDFLEEDELNNKESSGDHGPELKPIK